MMKQLLILIAATSLLVGCASKEQPSSRYKKISNADSERKSGRAMLYYEQAEKDLDINESVIVIPPDEKKKAVVSEEDTATKQ